MGASIVIDCSRTRSGNIEHIRLEHDLVDGTKTVSGASVASESTSADSARVH